MYKDYSSLAVFFFFLQHIEVSFSHVITNNPNTTMHKAFYLADPSLVYSEDPIGSGGRLPRADPENGALMIDLLR